MNPFHIAYIAWSSNTVDLGWTKIAILQKSAGVKSSWCIKQYKTL